MKMNYKGVSPLIATLLLIAVALVIAGILYTWSSSYFKLQTTEFETATGAQTACAFVGIEIDDSISSPTRCDFNATDQLSSMNRLSFKLSNAGTTDLNGEFTITATDGNNVVTLAYTPNLKVGSFVIIRCTNSTTETNGCRRTSTADFNALDGMTSLRVTPTDCPSKYDETNNCTTST